ncbi:ABC transporter substrate-binding protein [Roseomonas sp. GC11]|uniref:ABC transporter substrate-binding protein n=1 Tax=Roseomonas sp. GC11 TaxID=2950546 RepID=UPI00210C9B8A|nr:ABC transporter substrate-binding protein [Roseomonas sp. GC11]MCQ4159099.1 ABC transporter substrate-binding protein [Roseomonas sp. GC11]
MAWAAAPPRLVALDLLHAECLLTLELRPAALANLPLYRRLVAEPAPPAGLPDLGPAQEPNLEFLAALAPDAILAPSGLRASLARLGQVAPVLWLPTLAPEGDATGLATLLLRRIAALAGREAEAAAEEARFAAALASARARLAPCAGRPVFLARLLEDGRNIALFGGNSMLGHVLQALGLRNAWPGRGNAAGVAVAGLESLFAMPEAWLVHFDRGAETGRALARLAEGALWPHLPALLARRVLALPVVYPNGGLVSARRFAGALAEALPRAVGESPHG